MGEIERKRFHSKSRESLLAFHSDEDERKVCSGREQGTCRWLSMCVARYGYENEDTNVVMSTNVN